MLSILWGRVFWSMRGGVADDHHHRTVRVYLLGHSEEAEAVIGDQICEIILQKEEQNE